MYTWAFLLLTTVEEYMKLIWIRCLLIIIFPQIYDDRDDSFLSRRKYLEDSITCTRCTVQYSVVQCSTEAAAARCADTRDSCYILATATTATPPLLLLLLLPPPHHSRPPPQRGRALKYKHDCDGKKFICTEVNQVVMCVERVQGDINVTIIILTTLSMASPCIAAAASFRAQAPPLECGGPQSAQTLSWASSSTDLLNCHHNIHTHQHWPIISDKAEKKIFEIKMKKRERKLG